MPDAPSDNNKLRLRNTDTNRFKVETGHLKIQSQDAADSNASAAVPLSSTLGAGATQKAVNLNDPMSLRETSKGKLHKITGTGQTASLLNANAANLQTETIRLKVVKKSHQPGSGIPKSSSPLPLSGAVKPISLTAASPAPKLHLRTRNQEDAPAGDDAAQQPAASENEEHTAAPQTRPHLTLKTRTEPAADSSSSTSSSTASSATIAIPQPPLSSTTSGITPAKAVKPVIDTSTIKLNLKKKPIAAAAPKEPLPSTKTVTAAIPSVVQPTAAAHKPEEEQQAPAARPKLSLHLAKSPSSESHEESAPKPTAGAGATLAVQPPTDGKASATIAVQPPTDGKASATIAVQPPTPETPKKSSGLKLRLSKPDTPSPAAPAAAEAKPPEAEKASSEASESAPAHHGLKLKTQASSTIAVPPPAPADDKPQKDAAPANEEKPKLSISKKAQSTVSVPAPAPEKAGGPESAPARENSASADGSSEKQVRHILEPLSALVAAIAATVTVVSYVLSLLKL